MILFKGKKAKVGPVHTKDITLEDLRVVFFPKGFYEKYSYLGSIPWREEGDIFKSMEPLVIYMDYKAKPKLCPRWFIRFLNLFGSDNSIVRVRNRKLHDLKTKITKGIMIWDYKTKWSDYDLRISVGGTNEMQFLADAIEREFYDRGLREDLADQIKVLDPNTKYDKGNTPNHLREELNRLEELLEK